MSTSREDGGRIEKIAYIIKGAGITACTILQRSGTMAI